MDPATKISAQNITAALECALAFYLKTYNTTMTDDITTTSVLSTDFPPAMNSRNLWELDYTIPSGSATVGNFTFKVDKCYKTGMFRLPNLLSQVSSAAFAQARHSSGLLGLPNGIQFHLYPSTSSHAIHINQIISPPSPHPRAYVT